jgi:hypothetical protein
MNNSQCEYKGVFRGRRKYITKFAKRQDGKLNRFTIGSFKTQEEAAAAYDQTMRLVYGEFTYFNFPGTYIEILDTNELINRLEQNNLL